MKKALHISLAKTLFAVEEDGYAALESYLGTLRRHFSGSPSNDEIIADIEARLAEQFLETGHPVITHDDVASVIASMGKAEEFDGPHAEHAAPGAAPSSAPNAPASDATAKARRRLYRNPDDRIVAGVASGLAAYIGIDPLWMRLAFVVLSFGSGIGIVIYILLWLLVPEAETASQKLEMTGTPVTVETLSENVKEKARDIDARHGSKLRSVIALPFELLRKLFAFLFGRFLPAIGAVLGVVLATAAFVGAVALSFVAVMALTTPLDRYSDFPISEVFDAGVKHGAIIGGYLVALIPLVFVFLFAAGLVARRSMVKPGFGFGLIGLWAVALVMGGASVVQGNLSYADYVARQPAFAEETRGIMLSGEVRHVEVTGGNFLTLTQAPVAEFTATGRARDIDQLEIRQEGDVLTIGRKEIAKNCLFCSRRTPRLALALPDIDSLTAKAGSRVSSLGFSSAHDVKLTLESGSRGDISWKTTRLVVEASSGATFTLRGSAQTLDVRASSGADIDASALESGLATVDASSGSMVRVRAAQGLNAEASSGADVRYYGAPAVTERESSGGDVREAEPPEAPEAPDAPAEISAPTDGSAPIEPIAPIPTETVDGPQN